MSSSSLFCVSSYTDTHIGEHFLKYSQFICTAALVVGCFPAFGQTYSGSFHCAPSIDSPEQPAINVTAELTVKNGSAQLKRGSDKYEELLQGTVVGKSLELKGEGHFFDRRRSWTTQLKGSFDGNTFRSHGSIFNAKGKAVRDCETVLTGISAPNVQVTGARPSFDCQKATTEPEKMICGNPRLAALDASMAVAYKAAALRASDKPGLQQSQVDWRKIHRDTCTTETCMHDAYNSRLAYLREPHAESVARDTGPVIAPAPAAVPAVVAAPALVPMPTPTPVVEAPTVAASEPPAEPSLGVAAPAVPPPVVSAPVQIAAEPVKTSSNFSIPPIVWQLLLAGAVMVGIWLAVSAWLKRGRAVAPIPSNGGAIKEFTAVEDIPPPVIQLPSVQEGTHQVVLQGVRPGESLIDTKAKLVALLKASPQQVKVLLATQGYVLKRGLQLDVAEKYKAALQSAGAVCEIMPDSPLPDTLDIDLPVEGATSRLAGAAQTWTSSTAPTTPNTVGTLAFNDPLRADESVLFEGDVTKIKSLLSITQGTGTVTNQRCLFHWGNETFAAEKGELTSLVEQKHGFGTKILVQKNGESVMVMAANMKGLKSSLYALAGMPFDEAGLKQPELSAVKNTTAWIAAFGPMLAGLFVVLLAAIMGWNLDNASGMDVVKFVILRLVLIYTFMRIDHLSLQAQGYNTNALGIVPPEQFPIYLFSRAKVFGHSKSYAITWCVLIGIDILVMFL